MRVVARVISMANKWIVWVAVVSVMVASQSALATPLFAIPKSLRQLEGESIRLQTERAALPGVSDSLQLDAYGHHGGYLPVLATLPATPRWTVDVTFGVHAKLDQILLVPAIDRRFDAQKSYGFPKRLRVLQLFPDGSQLPIKEWMTVDCPDPGRMPLVLDLSNPHSNAIRIEVFRGAEEGGKELFALDEIFGVVAGEILRIRQVTAQPIYESLPYWGLGFLIDQKTSLGLPVGSMETDPIDTVASDFSVVLDTQPVDPCVLELDLGKNCRLGWITLFPALPPEGIMIPGYGFPGRIVVDVAVEESGGGRAESIRLKDEWAGGSPGNNVVRIPGFNKEARWVRLTVSDFPVHNGRRTFAMGEINVYRQAVVYPVRSIKLEGFPLGTVADAEWMTDRLSDGRPIMFLLDWLRQIHRKSWLTQRRDEVLAARAQLSARWRLFWRVSGMVAFGFFFLTALGVAAFSVFQRHRHARLLRQQISSDLHDDIGSKVAAISLASTYVERNAIDPSVRRRGARIQSMAHAMHQGLRDVLWLTDTRTDTSDQLVQKLADCARVGIAAERLALKISPTRLITPRSVSVQMKRDLLLFFKEALHNAASHSAASEIRVEVLVQGRKLQLTVQDNGTGFVLSAKGDDAVLHHGLRTMRERSKRLRAELDIQSVMGHGTTVSLRVSF